MLARTKEWLDSFVNEIKGSKGDICDFWNISLIKEICIKIKNDMSLPQILILNVI